MMTWLAFFRSHWIEFWLRSGRTSFFFSFLFFSFLPGTVRISQYVIVFVIERGERNLTH